MNNKTTVHYRTRWSTEYSNAGSWYAEFYTVAADGSREYIDSSSMGSANTLYTELKGISYKNREAADALFAAHADLLAERV